MEEIRPALEPLQNLLSLPKERVDRLEVSLQGILSLCQSVPGAVQIGPQVAPQGGLRVLLGQRAQDVSAFSKAPPGRGPMCLYFFRPCTVLITWRQGLPFLGGNLDFQELLCRGSLIHFQVGLMVIQSR